MADRIRAQNVNEAIAIAGQLRGEGQYDRFRGQFQDWRLCPSALRLTEAQRDNALEKIARFEHWIRATPELDYLLVPDMFFAVAQHYGFPTNYIDFTTDASIAGFFAADNPGNKPAVRDSCIICANSHDLVRFWKSLPARTPPPEWLEIDVSNLWRLQAQEGCFLFCQYDDIERIYDFDRIVFPYRGPVTSTPRERIYPREKSALEILLDQFMMTERLREGTAAVRAMPAMRDMVVYCADSTEVDSEVLARDLHTHSSWSTSALQPWLSVADENYHKTVQGQVFRIHVDVHALVDRSVLRDQIGAGIARRPELRMASVDWDVTAVSPFEMHQPDELAEALNHLWDGIRRLPYTDEQICYAIAETIGLWHESRGGSTYSADQGRPAAEKCFGDVMEIEFGALDGSYSRAYGSVERLTNAIRSDIHGYLAREWTNTFTVHPVGLVQVIRRASLLFDFLRLADFVVRQIVPFQIVFRRRDRAVFFSPARLERVGRP